MVSQIWLVAAYSGIIISLPSLVHISWTQHLCLMEVSSQQRHKVTWIIDAYQTNLFNIVLVCNSLQYHIYSSHIYAHIIHYWLLVTVIIMVRALHFLYYQTPSKTSHSLQPSLIKLTWTWHENGLTSHRHKWLVWKSISMSTYIV